MPTKPPAEVLKPIETWATEMKVDVALFAVAKAITPGWGAGREVTEDAFKTAMDRAGKLEIR